MKKPNKHKDDEGGIVGDLHRVSDSLPVIKTCPVLVLLLALSLVGPFCSCSRPIPNNPTSATPEEQLKEVLQKNQFRNLCFDFATVESEKLDGQENYSVTGWNSAKMCVNGEPNSLVKATYAPHTMRWVDGIAPYYQENKTVAYNGKYWISEVTDSGAINAMTRHPEAKITAKCPSDWDPKGWTTGEVFFVTHAPFHHQLTLAQTVGQFSWLSWLQPILRVTKDNDILKISTVNALPSAEIWLDMQKGGALKKLITKSKMYTEEITVDRFQEVDGIWFPAKGTRILKTDTQETKLDFSASNFSRIDSAQNLYDVKLEPGCRIQDMRH